MKHQPVREVPRRLVTLLVLTAAAWGASSCALADDRVVEALRLYDQERYADARQILERVDREGGLEGAMLYRLSFCLRVAGERDAERAILERARAALEQEAPQSAELEAPFYLVNTYVNLDRPVDARRAAAAALARVDSGDLRPKDDALDQFRLAKLYADQGNSAAASRWYRRAAEGFAQDPTAYPAYLRWARRYLAENTVVDEDWPAIEKELAALAAQRPLSGPEYDRLAVARVRLRDWAGASDAWKLSQRAPQADTNRANYCWRLAAMAAGLGTLPEQAPDDRPWSHVSKAELETLLTEQAASLRQARAAAVGADEATRKTLEGRLREIKSVFVAAGLEYAARRHPIRETAFFGGYAPLIFKEHEWELPEEPRSDRPGRPASGS